MTLQAVLEVFSKNPKALAWVTIGEERSGLLLNLEVGWEGAATPSQLGFEPDSFDLGLWLRHEATNRLEDARNWLSYFFSNSLSRRASVLFEPIISRS